VISKYQSSTVFLGPLQLWNQGGSCSLGHRWSPRDTRFEFSHLYSRSHQCGYSCL